MTATTKAYLAIKEKYKDAIILFRTGAMYKAFGQDAVLTANILHTELTTEGAPEARAVTWFPHQTLDTALHKLVKAGHKVGICDPLEGPER